MTDFALEFDPILGCADIVVSGGGFEVHRGLETAVLLSLLTDRRANEDDQLTDGETDFGTGDLRGWWGDEFQPLPGDEYGSRLWTLRRSKLTEETLASLQEIVSESLDWLVQRSIAASVDVVVEVVERGRADVTVTINKQSEVPVQFTYTWDAMEGLSIG